MHCGPIRSPSARKTAQNKLQQGRFYNGGRCYNRTLRPTLELLLHRLQSNENKHLRPYSKQTSSPVGASANPKLTWKEIVASILRNEIQKGELWILAPVFNDSCTTEGTEPISPLSYYMRIGFQKSDFIF